MARRPNPESLTELPLKKQQPDEGGSYTRCLDSGDLTLVARTDLEPATDDATINFDSQESQA